MILPFLAVALISSINDMTAQLLNQSASICMVFMVIFVFILPRFIAISVYSTLIVCLSAIPVYLTGSSVLHKVSTISTALILNGYLTLVLLFLPKIYAAKYLPAEMAMESWRAATATGNTNRVGVMRGNSVETEE